MTMGASFCPNCGVAAQPGARFCASCGQALATTPALTHPQQSDPTPPSAAAPPRSFTEQYGSSQPVPPAPPVPTETGRSLLRPLAIIGGLVLIGVAVALGASGALNGGGDNGVGGAPAGGAPSPSIHVPQPMTFVPAPTEESVILPTEAPAPAAGDVVRVGETVSIECDDEPCYEVTLVKTDTAASYGSGYSIDKPKKGNEYLAAYITYKALKGGAEYCAFDWQLYHNDTLIEDTAYVSEGPTPELGCDELAAGRSAKGWIVWEVPKTGRLVLSYTPNYGEDPIFDIVLRR
jgi:zinc ribbon protein